MMSSFCAALIVTKFDRRMKLVLVVRGSIYFIVPCVSVPDRIDNNWSEICVSCWNDLCLV